MPSLRPALQCYQIPPPKTDTVGTGNASVKRAIPVQDRTIPSTSQEVFLSVCSTTQETQTFLGRSPVSGALSPGRGRFPKRLFCSRSALGFCGCQGLQACLAYANKCRWLHLQLLSASTCTLHSPHLHILTFRSPLWEARQG